MSLRCFCFLTFLLATLPLCGNAHQISKDAVLRPIDRKLVDAVYQEDAGAVKRLLKQGANPNLILPDEHESLLLKTVAINGTGAIIPILIAAGADVHARTPSGDTVLMNAIHGMPDDSDPVLLKLLLDHGVDIHAKNTAGATVMAKIHGYSAPEVVRLLLDRGGDIHYKGPGHLLPLSYAALAADPTRIKALLHTGEPVNGVDAEGWPPLMHAAQQGAVSCVHTLLVAGAEVNFKDQRGDNALLTAIGYDQPAAAAELLKVKGIDVSAVSSFDHTTALAMALERDEADLAPAIVAHGADVNVRGGNRETALYLAASRGHTDVVRLLLAKGADPKADNNGQDILLAPIEYTENPPLELIKLLLDHGVNPTGGEPLMAAVNKSNQPLAALLLERGAKIDLVDEGGKTALHWAAWYGLLDTVKRLLARGADVNRKDVQGQTPLMLAQRANRHDVAMLLMQHGGTAQKVTEPPIKKNALGQKMYSLPIPMPKSISGPEVQSLSLVTGNWRDPLRVMYHLQGGKTITSAPISFAPIYNTGFLWEPAERNEVTYALNRGADVPDAYDFYGTVTLHNTTYVGVRWYSPTFSARDQNLSCVFQVRLDKQALELTLIHKKSATTRIMLSHEMGPFSNLPILRLSKTGTLLRLDEDGKYEYNEMGTWSKVGPGPPIINNIASDPQQYKKQESALAVWMKTDR